MSAVGRYHRVAGTDSVWKNPAIGKRTVAGIMVNGTGPLGISHRIGIAVQPRRVVARHIHADAHRVTACSQIADGERRHRRRIVGMLAEHESLTVAAQIGMRARRAADLHTPDIARPRPRRPVVLVGMRVQHYRDIAASVFLADASLHVDQAPETGRHIRIIPGSEILRERFGCIDPGQFEHHLMARGAVMAREPQPQRRVVTAPHLQQTPHVELRIVGVVAKRPGRRSLLRKIDGDAPGH